MDIAEILTRFIHLEINFWTGAISLVLFTSGFLLIAASIFSVFLIKNSYPTKAKILGYIHRPIEKIKDGETIIENDYKLVYEYTNPKGEVSTEIGSDWSSTHSQHFTACIVPVRVYPHKNYADIYLNISNTVQIFVFLGTLLISVGALFTYTTIKSLTFFVFILFVSILCVLGLAIYMYLDHKHNDLKDQRPTSKIFTLSEIKPLEEFPDKQTTTSS